jgi:hypothetical protein
VDAVRLSKAWLVERGFEPTSGKSATELPRNCRTETLADGPLRFLLAATRLGETRQIDNVAV